MITTEQAKAISADFLAFVELIAMPLPGGPATFGPRMADFQRRDFMALAPSLHALAAGMMPPMRRFWLERTKGASKDSDVTVALLWLLGFASRAVRIQVIADDQQQALEIKLIVEQILAIDAPLNRLLASVITVLKSTIKSERNGSTVEILTRDDTGTHGSRPDLVVANELTHISNEDFASTVVDNADKVPTSVVIVATNAGWQDCWQLRWREIAQSSDRWYFATVSTPAPWISVADLAESRRRNPPLRYARLWEGKWVGASGDIIPPDAIERSIVLSGPMLNATCQHQAVILGCDAGLRRDHFGLALLGVDVVQAKLRLLDCRSWAPLPGGEVSFEEVRQTILDLHRRHGISVVVFDPWNMAHMAQLLRQDGLPTLEWPYTPANCSKLATQLLAVFVQGQIECYRDELLLRDLGRIAIQETIRGFKIVATRTSEGHADRASALALAAAVGVDVSAEILRGAKFSRPQPELENARILAKWREEQRRKGPMSLADMLRDGGVAVGTRPDGSQYVVSGDPLLDLHLIDDPR
jgi:hypothetical protein